MIVLLFFLPIVVGEILKNQAILIKDFLSVKSNNGGIIVTCENLENKVRLLKHLSEEEISVSILEYNQFLNTDWGSLNTPIGIILNTKNCDNSTAILDHASSLEMFRSKYKWLMISESIEDLKTNIADINVDSDVTVVIETQNSYDIFNLYQEENAVKCHAEKVGRWYRNFGWKRLNHEKTRVNFHKRKLRASFVIIGRPKFESLSKYLMNENEKTNDSLSKDHYGILLLLGQLYNFTIDLYRTKTWGYLENGNFNGMIGMLLNNESDIGGSPIYIKEERIAVTDIYAETRTQKVAVVFRHPKTSGRVEKLLITPLQPLTWYATILCLLAAFVTILISLYLFNLNKFNSEEDKSLSTTLLFIIGAISQQGYKNPSSRASVRIALFTILLFSLLLNQFYGASVVSSLLKETPKTIKTPQDLIKSSLNIKVEDLAYHKVYFKTSKIKIVQEMYQNKILKGPGSGFVLTPTGVDLIRKGGTGFMMDVDNGYSFIEKSFSMTEICELCEIQLSPLNKLYGAIKKNSPYLDYFKIGYLKLYEGGITKKENRRWQTSKPKCVKELTQNEFNVGIPQLSLAYMILTAGTMISSIIRLVEIIYVKLKKKTEKNVVLNISKV